MKKPAVQIILLLLISLVSVSCASETDAYARLVAEWQGREIVFPDVMTDVLTGDTLDLSEADFTIITYIDSAGCTACKMKLSIWEEFLGSLDSIAGDAEFNSLIFINAKDSKELLYLIQRENYTYPVINDTNDLLNKTNQFPDNTTFRTFLLNRNKHVVAVGNPAYNNGIAELFRSIISGRKTFNHLGTQMIVADDSKKEIGEVRLGAVYTADYTLNNESMDTVFVREVISSCHCTEAIIPGNTIPPNGALPVQIKFHEDSLTGDFVRSVHIYYQEFENPTVLEISGTVIK
ncbi:MAG: DUF1573 domain-containing protein [Duncaniella sp.]|nr:DUF1573 domain-containing protein [Duncaniella sp.]